MGFVQTANAAYISFGLNGSLVFTVCDFSGICASADAACAFGRVAVQVGVVRTITDFSGVHGTDNAANCAHFGPCHTGGILVGAIGNGTAVLHCADGADGSSTSGGFEIGVLDADISYFCCVAGEAGKQSGNQVFITIKTGDGMRLIDVGGRSPNRVSHESALIVCDWFPGNQGAWVGIDILINRNILAQVGVGSGITLIYIPGKPVKVSYRFDSIVIRI